MGKKGAFTLVELIVVIIILAILATIGFVSFSGYLAGTRDTNRIAQLKSMSDALELYRTKKDLPIPDDKVDIQASATTIAYQGYIGANVLETIEYTEKGLDPKDKVYFSYYLTKNKKYFQLLGFLEETNTDVVTNNNSVLNRIQAVDYSARFPKVTGKKLGILTGTGTNLHIPIQELSAITASGYLDILTTSNTYNAILDDETTISGNKNITTYLSFYDKEKLKTDSSFLGYWYFNDTNEGKDFSASNNTFTTNNEVEFGDNAFFDKSKTSYLESNSITLGTDFTILLKFSVNEHTGWSSSCHNTNLIGQHNNGGCTNDGWGMAFTHHATSINFDKRIRFNYGDGSTWQGFMSANQYDLGTDIFVGLKKEGDTYSMYVNGELDSTGDILNMQENSYNLRIGGTNGQYFDGNIYYGAIIDYAIGEDLIKLLSKNEVLWVK